ncbi:SAM-dependent methyltransferase [Actinomadura alba]|uniref:SAM-dependent methyltransferase n=2 Tax=Actinomadura alba TaxID=406431 RepID=A0ABR7LPM3_9ACTN|nr:SAM-dependent methyltransferase [Actinomadura alba]
MRIVDLQRPAHAKGGLGYGVTVEYAQRRYSLVTDDSPAPHPKPSDAIDTTVPHSARIWNYWLGGKDNYAVDRAAGDKYRQAFPGVDEIARASRHFLTRTIRYLAGEVGIRQFLDIGTGLPTVDNTHEIAQRLAPESRIVYVDNDPLVLVHARALLDSTPEGASDYIHADLREPDEILDAAAKTLDFSLPTALILSGILGHVHDTDEARSIVKRLLRALPSGGYLSINDGTSVIGGEVYEQAQQGYNKSGAVPYNLRTPEEIASFFEGLELVEPGVVSCPLWRPDRQSSDDPPAAVDAFGGVGRKL